eukprot:TRINITY_DN74770_c0_g1_i1.p1 TRINITY_DN74770_c0_g1~~TRINITY_DN74770_c0_g1_i1.p1  ORF type:complete len:445 (-),score=58.67 TRINITY_DN74770_c0_g1_i1:13-1236(-)
MLPVVEHPASATMHLIRELRERVVTGFGYARERTPYSASARAAANKSRTSRDACLMTTSEVGLRANERLADVDVDPLGVTTSSGGGVRDNIACGVAVSSRELAASFEKLVKSVEASLSGQEGAILPLKRGEQVQDSVPIHGTRHYRVVLPVRPTAVNVSVMRAFGAMPLMLWGSTSCSRPHAKDYDVRSKDDESMIYRHELRSSLLDPEGDIVDRRTAVPSCGELFVTVEGTATSSAYSITVSFEPIKIVRSRIEIHWDRQVSNMTWEARLREIKRDPTKREELFERVREIEDDHKAKCLQRLSEKNFLESNRQASAQALPVCKEVRRRQKALKLHAHMDAVHARRNRIDEERAARRTKGPREDSLQDRIVLPRSLPPMRTVAPFVTATVEATQKLAALEDTANNSV